MAKEIRIGAFDDHPIILTGLTHFFEDCTRFELIFTCCNPEELLVKIELFRPDILIMDVIVQGGEGLEIFQQIRDQYPEIILISFSNVSSKLILDNLYAIGSWAFVSKREDLSLLQDVINYVVSMGKPYYTLPLGGNGQKFKTLFILTEREKSILGHIINGLPSKQIADIECISIHTVDFHRRALFRKFEAVNMAELVREGIEFGFKPIRN